jgi:regulator of nonsense transcripts 2
MAGELWLFGVFWSVVPETETKDKPSPHGIVYTILRDLLADDKDNANLPIAVHFAKNFGHRVLGIVPRKSKDKEVDETNVQVVQREAFKDMLLGYYRDKSTILVKEHKRIRKMEKRTGEWAIHRGEITEEAKQAYDKSQKAYEKLIAHLQTMADALDQDFPDLPEDDVSTSIGLSVLGRKVRGDDDKDKVEGVWEDDDAKQFYEVLIDLQVMVPSIAMPPNQKKTTETATEEHEAITINDKLDEDDEEGVKTDEVQGGKSAQLDSLITRLTNVGNRDVMDQITIDFCYMNSKQARKRLAQELFRVPKNRLDLLPYYARMIATVHLYLPDIGNAVLTALEGEFRFFTKSKKKKEIMERRIKVGIRHLTLRVCRTFGIWEN